MKYPVAKPCLNGNELKYVKEAVQDGWVSSQGPYVEKFEESFASYIGTKYAVACSSGTAALTLALAALDIGPGDEVIVPEFTMVATAWAVTYRGATPVFVDCGDDLNVSVSGIEKAITSRTKAIIPVHIYGRPADMVAIKKLVKGKDIAVIEDAAEAHGAEIEGKKVGSFGDMGCFSLYANKIITSGEGGIVTTDDRELRDELRRLRSMYFNKDHTFLHPKLGYNFRMTNLQAAVALAQVEVIDSILDRRRAICAEYDKYLGDYTIPRPDGSVLWMYDIVTDKADDVMEACKAAGIESRLFFKPMSQQPMYEGNYGALNAYSYSRSGLYLPVYLDLTNDDIEFICRTVSDVLVS